MWVGWYPGDTSVSVLVPSREPLRSINFEKYIQKACRQIEEVKIIISLGETLVMLINSFVGLWVSRVSVAGSCHCGQCICSLQEGWVSGEYCECDDRECDKHDGLICTGTPEQLHSCYFITASKMSSNVAVDPRGPISLAAC